MDDRKVKTSAARQPWLRVALFFLVPLATSVVFSCVGGFVYLGVDLEIVPASLGLGLLPVPGLASFVVLRVLGRYGMAHVVFWLWAAFWASWIGWIAATPPPSGDPTTEVACYMLAAGGTATVACYLALAVLSHAFRHR